MRVPLLEFSYPPDRLQNVHSWEERSILVTERLVIHLCGQSRRKHVAVIIMAALMGNRIISY